MLSHIRVADVLLLLLITQTTQAGPPQEGLEYHLQYIHHQQQSCCDIEHLLGTSCPSHIKGSNHTRAVDLNPGIPVNTNDSVGAGFATPDVKHYILAVTIHIRPKERILFVSSCTANVETSSPPASLTTIAAAPTTAFSVPPTTSPTVPLATLSSTLRVTGTPNNQVPTIRTSTPAASATISPEIAANNLASAKAFNTLFASLTEQSACDAGQIACVKGNVGICGSNGAFAIQNCGTGTSCFALPMNTTEGVIVGCYDPKMATGILGTPVPAPVPGSSTSASAVASGTTTTVTPTVIATYTVSIIPPAASPQTSSAVQAPGFTTTVVVTKTMEPVPAPSSTTTEEDGPPTTSTSRRRTRTTTSESSPVSTTAETTRQSTHSKSTRASTALSSTGTFTDTLIVNPIPTDEPSEPPTLVGGITPTAIPPPGTDVSQGTPTVTVFVTVTQKERETVTVTVTKG
ncbi:hypothetical protein LX32DRAFT_648550 [Colletotrichum zoysiae]|uniref:Carbohydrate-binding module family 19 domain-containing protein n=1 Tax=Colletotrichum zoysiae TaxID=1216348 RepID=A0AAD9HU17_9PEZI|nr:hypothetical protein LX32DRAFT_648550 [Colletotrichum zoysiae]